MPSYVVTGASRGIGLEFARQLAAKADNRVFALVRNPSGATELQDLAKTHSNLTVVKLDITSPEDWKSAAAAVGEATGGSLDVLIHNATTTNGTTATPTAWEGREHAAELKAEILQCVQDNTLSQIDGNTAFLPLILKGTVKKVIAITSAIGVIENVLLSEVASAMPYAINKAAMNMLVAKYAVELKPMGVKFLSLSPGWVKTHDDPAQNELDKKVLQIFRRIEPDVKGREPVENAVRDCLNVIDTFGWDVNGMTISHLGNQKWMST